MADRIATARTGFEALEHRLERASPEDRLAHHRQRVDDQARRAERAMAHRLEALSTRLTGQRLRLAALDPAGVLGRGYAVVTADATGEVIASVAQAAPGIALHIRVADGAFGATAAGSDNRPSGDVA
jgi:exodeoxyribonuclease VII large subunit